MHPVEGSRCPAGPHFPFRGRAAPRRDDGLGTPPSSGSASVLTRSARPVWTAKPGSSGTAPHLGPPFPPPLPHMWPTSHWGGRRIGDKKKEDGSYFLDGWLGVVRSGGRRGVRRYGRCGGVRVRLGVVWGGRRGRGALLFRLCACSPALLPSRCKGWGGV